MNIGGEIYMALRFSHVTVVSDQVSESLLVGGVSDEYEDLEGWRIFDRFLDEIDEGTEVSVHVESYLYGDGDAVDATPEEIVYLMNRIAMRPDFLSARCKKAEESDFSFARSADERFNFSFLEQ